MRFGLGLLGGLLVIATLLASPGMASAGPIIIDDFLTAQSVLQMGPGGPTTSGPLAGSHLGGRIIRASQGAGSALAASAGISIAGGLASLTTSTLTDTATFSLGYGAFGPLDISGLGQVEVPFFSFDADGNPLSMTLTVFDSSLASHSETIGIPAADIVPPGTTFIFPLGLFDPALDLTQISRFVFRFDSTNLGGGADAQDFVLGGGGGIRITEVPEPGTLALLAGMIGLTGLWYSRRLRVRSA
jgi:hypothetical protein